MVYIHTSVFYNLNQNGLISNTVPSSAISQLASSITSTIPEDYKKNIKGITFKSSVSNNTVMLIFHLSRDQHLRFKKIALNLCEEHESLISVYAEYNDHYYLLGGCEYLVDKINDHIFNISPFSSLKILKQNLLYKKILDLSPKGRTRNSIIIDSLAGLLPTHIAHLFNRIYCVDLNEKLTKDAKNNLNANKINNCLLFSSDVQNWLKEFNDYKYTPPGKKHKIGLSIIRSDLLSEESCKLLLNIEPETIILFSESIHSISKIVSEITKTTKNRYKSTYAIKLDYFYLNKLKRRDGEQQS